MSPITELKRRRHQLEEEIKDIDRRISEIFLASKMQKLAVAERQAEIISQDYAEIFNTPDYLVKKLFMPISEVPGLEFSVAILSSLRKRNICYLWQLVSRPPAYWLQNKAMGWRNVEAIQKELSRHALFLGMNLRQLIGFC